MPTVTELLTEVRDIIDEPTAAQWTDAMLRKWLNEANRDLARSTRHLKATETIVIVGGQGTYQTSASVVAIENAWYHDVAGDRHIPLTPKHLENMDPIRGYNWDREGTPSFYSTQGYNPVLQVVLFPNPTVDDDELILNIAKLPTEIDVTGAGDGDDVDTPLHWYDALADYCEYKALRRDRDPRWQEALAMYKEKREGLIHNPDYLPINREMIVDPHVGYMPRWLVEFEQ